MIAKRMNLARSLSYRSAACALVLAFLSSTVLPVSAADYRLGPQDKVRIKIYEWRASRDEIFEWNALNDVFVVGAGGTLSLPFAGEIAAAGLTPAEVSAHIGDGLMEKMGLGRRPDASVEVVEFRPFFILGEVGQPGAFPYQPGLTVLQAVSLAGGIKSEAERPMRLERERIQSRGEISLIGLERLGLIARKSRLEAELANLEAITFPKELTDLGNDVVATNSMAQEQLIFEARQKAVHTQIQALDDLAGFLEKELVSLEKQLGFLDKQIELIEKELGNVSSLVARGIAPAPREMALERALAQIQSERLTSETGLLRARQEISKTNLLKLELRNNHANEVATSLREAESALAATERRAETALHLLHESETLAPVPIDLIKYSIVRTSDAGTETIAAGETTQVLPGDTVKVEVPLSPQQASIGNVTGTIGQTQATANMDF